MYQLLAVISLLVGICVRAKAVPFNANDIPMKQLMTDFFRRMDRHCQSAGTTDTKQPEPDYAVITRLYWLEDWRLDEYPLMMAFPREQLLQANFSGHLGSLMSAGFSNCLVFRPVRKNRPSRQLYDRLGELKAKSKGNLCAVFRFCSTGQCIDGIVEAEKQDVLPMGPFHNWKMEVDKDALVSVIDSDNQKYCLANLSLAVSEVSLLRGATAKKKRVIPFLPPMNIHPESDSFSSKALPALCVRKAAKKFHWLRGYLTDRIRCPSPRPDAELQAQQRQRFELLQQC